MNIGSDVKVKPLSGKYAEYVRRSGREGKLIKIDGENGLVRFPQTRRDFSYYFHDHWIRLKDLREIHHLPAKKAKQEKKEQNR